MSLLAPVSVGDLADRISILDIKLERIAEPEKRRNIAFERACLYSVWAGCRLPPDLDTLLEQLREVNGRIWEMEESAHVEPSGLLLSRIVLANDQRAALKRTLNRLSHSVIVEEKSHKEVQGCDLGHEKTPIT